MEVVDNASDENNEKIESYFITHDKLKEGKELIISVE